MRPLVWFRSDLRVRENTALSAACASSTDGVVAVYVISPEDWRAHDVGGAQVDFILRTLRILSVDLARLNIPLIVRTAERRAEIPALLLGLAREHRATELHYNAEYEVDESSRDQRVSSAFAEVGLKAHAHTDQVVLDPATVRTGEGRFFTVFTPYKRAWIREVLKAGGVRTLPAVEPVKPIEVRPTPVPSEVAEFRSPVPADLWPAGEAEASARLSRFIEERIRGYKAQRDFPSVEGTSRLSPYLAIGAISPRTCVSAAVRANVALGGAGAKSPLDSGNIGITTWISELIWREFYTHVVVGFPRVCMGRAFQPATDRLPWSSNEGHFAAWCEGRTGVPIVDAAMRSLKANAWMHNRLRMIVAMFLSKDLFLDWRWGERHFARHLIDFNFASNNGGWQWSASTGTDAAPYFRIFNPYSQSRNFDPDGQFIRRWVPELRDVGADAIHDPSKLPAFTRSKLGYPEPIVDHAAARDRVVAAFKSIKPLLSEVREGERVDLVRTGRSL